MKLLVSKKQAANPMYLALACEELRVFGVFEKMTAKLKSIPHTMTQLLGEILERLEADHGREVLSAALSLLVCSRNGRCLHGGWILECLEGGSRDTGEARDGGGGFGAQVCS